MVCKEVSNKRKKNMYVWTYIWICIYVGVYVCVYVSLGVYIYMYMYKGIDYFSFCIPS